MGRHVDCFSLEPHTILNSNLGSFDECALAHATSQGVTSLPVHVRRSTSIRVVRERATGRAHDTVGRRLRSPALASALFADRHMIGLRHSSPSAPRPGWQRLDVLLVVAAGGLLGAPARYGVGQLLPPDKDGFPWSTFLINVSGALLLGILVELVRERLPNNRYARAFFGTGFLGAYTTFSTYTAETVLLAKDGYVAEPSLTCWAACSRACSPRGWGS